MSSLYFPDNWQLVRVIPKDTSAIYYRILAGWSGSFIYGSSWKLSSGFGPVRNGTFGCKQVIDEGNDPEGFGLYGDSWRVPQSSGSVYILRENSEQPSMATAGVLESVMKSNPDVKLEIVKMESILSEFGL